jgi:hypothetical protein
MDVRFIAVVAGGFVLILCAGLAFPPMIRKAYAGAPNRLLINAEIRARYGSRAVIATQILVIIAFVATFSLSQDRATLLYLYFFVLLVCIAARTIFREMRIAAETELKVRNTRGEQV